MNPSHSVLPSAALPAYAELHSLSNFSFQRGASSPEELVARAHALGYTALAITDECSMAGVVRAHGEAKRLGIQLLIGTELRVEAEGDEESFTLVLLARNRAGYGELCELITRLRRASSVTIPPALRIMCASPVLRPSSSSTVMRASMHATTASLRPGGIGRCPRLNFPA